MRDSNDRSNPRDPHCFLPFNDWSPSPNAYNPDISPTRFTHGSPLLYAKLEHGSFSHAVTSVASPGPKYFPNPDSPITTFRSAPRFTFGGGETRSPYVRSCVCRCSNPCCTNHGCRLSTRQPSDSSSRRSSLSSTVVQRLARTPTPSGRTTPAARSRWSADSSGRRPTSRGSARTSRSASRRPPSGKPKKGRAGDAVQSAEGAHVSPLRMGSLFKLSQDDVESHSDVLPRPQPLVFTFENV